MIVRFLLILSVVTLCSCTSKTEPKYYGFDSKYKVLDNRVVINPRPIREFTRLTKVTINNVAEGKSLGNFSEEEQFKLISTDNDLYVYEVKSSFLDYECTIGADGKIVNGNVSRQDVSKLNFQNLDESIRDAIESSDFYTDYDEYTLCGTLAEFFKTREFSHLSKNQRYSDAMKFLDVEKLFLAGVSKDDFSMDSVTLGKVNCSGGECILNGTSASFDMPVSVEGQSFRLGISLKGYSLINIDHGANIIDDFVFRLTANNNLFMTMKIKTLVYDIIL